MKKAGSKMISILLAVMIVVGSCFNPSVVVSGAEVNTTKIITGLKLVGDVEPTSVADDGTKTYVVKTGTSLNMYANFEVSGTDVNIPNATVKISLPKDGKNYIRSVNFTGSYNATNVVFSGNKDPNEFSVSYEFKELRGGMVGGYPFSFKFENLITPPNVEQPVFLTIFDGNGNIVYNKQDKVILKTNASTTYNAAVYVSRLWQKSGQFQKGPDYLNTDPPAATPEDPNKTALTFYNHFVPLGSGTGGDYGEYRATKIKVVDHLPAGAVFLEDNATNKKYGWKKVDTSTYEAVLDKNDPAYKTIFEGANLVVPIVMGFPNQPLTTVDSTTRTTATFVNTSDFFYYTYDADGKEKETKIEASVESRSAKASIYYLPYVAGGKRSYTFNKKILGGRENYVTVSDDPDQVSILNGYEGALSFPNAKNYDFVNAYPEENKDRPLWKTTTDVNQYTQSGVDFNGESLKRVLDRTLGVHTLSTGFKDDGTWAENVFWLTNARMYYKDVIVKAEAITDHLADASNSLADLKNSKFWLFKSIAAREKSYYAASIDGFGNTENKNKPTYLVPVADHPFGFDELIHIDDEGGYYNALLMIATDDLKPAEVAAIKNQSVVPWEKVMEEYKDGSTTKWRLKGMENNTGDEHSLRLKNVSIHQEITYRQVKEGNISISPDNTVFKAPHNFDILAKFCDDVLKAQNDNDPNTNPGEVVYTVFPVTWIPTADDEFDQTTPVRERPEDGGIRTDFGEDIRYIFYPNNGKINLTVSGDKSYAYIDKEPIHTGSFTSSIFGSQKDITAKNVKGIVLLPPGVEYVSTKSFGQALSEPEIVDNFKNIGKQAIVYTFGDINVKGEEVKSLGKVEYNVKITRKTKDSSSTGKGNEVQTWMSWDNSSTVWATTEKNGNGNVEKDVWDLNQNDKDTDSLLKGKYDIYYYAPAEAIISKYVSDGSTFLSTGTDAAGTETTGTDTTGNWESWSHWTQSSQFIDAGGDVYFRMFLVNQYTKTIDKLTVVERMPAVGDHKMVDNEEGEFPLRGPNYSQTGSSYPAHLTMKLGELQANKDVGMFDFEYTLSPILSDSENPDAYAEYDIVKEEEWIPEADLDERLAQLGRTMDDITGFRATLKEGQKITGISEENRAPAGTNAFEWYKNHPQLGNTVSIYVPTKLPFDTSLDRNLPAYMSSAFKLASPDTAEYGAYPLNEGNEVKIRNMYYTVSGTVFRDYKHTGDISDNRIEGVKATLQFAEDTMIDGVTYEAGTAVPKKFMKAGRYDKDANEVVPVEEEENTPAADTTTASPLRAARSLAAAVEEDTVPTYTDQDGNYYFVVYRRGKYQVQFDIENGDEKTTFVQYGSTEGRQRANTTAKTLAEYPTTEPLPTTTTSVAYEASPARIHYNLDGSIDYMGGTLNRVFNAAIDDQKRDVVVYKYGLSEGAGADAQGVALSAGFTLKGVTDSDYTREFTTDKQTGEFRIEDVPYGTYTLEETTAPEGIARLEHPMQIVVSAEGVTFDIANDDYSYYSFSDERIEVKNVVPKGKITVEKTSSMTGEPLAGVVFGIYQNGKAVLNDKGEALQATTDETGKAVFKELLSGAVYSIREEAAIDGYTTKWQKSGTEVVDLKDGTDVELPLKKDVKVSVPLNNIPYMGTIKVKKSGEDGSPLPGTTFGLYDKNAPAKLIKEAVTNDVGVAAFENVVYGTYTVKETKAAEGYVPTRISDEVAIASDGATYWIPGIGQSISNVKIRGNIAFTKVDEAGKPMEDATFTLYKGTSASGDALKTATTKADGKVLFENLEYGSYTIRETTTPEGYVTAPDMTASIKEDGKTVDLGNVVNNRIKGKIQFTKVDADGYGQDPKKIIPIPDVKFDLYKAKLQDGKYVEDGAAIDNTTSDAKGIVAFNDVPYGHYVIKESEAGEGYNGSSELLHVQIAENGKTYIPTDDGYFTNKVITGTVKLQKTDENGAALAGAKFTLSNDKRSYTATSGSDGKVEFDDVLYGTYTLKEDSAPTMYDRWVGSKEVKVETQDQTVDAGTVTNTLIRGSIQVSKTAAFDNAPLENTAFTIYKSVDEEGNPADPVEKDGKPYTVETDENGKAVFESLPYGTYYVQETEAPEGYLLNSEVKEVKIIQTKADNYKVAFVDEKIRGSVEITKLDADNNSKLAGAKFKLFKMDEEDGKEVSGDVFKEGEAEFEAVTGDNGIAVIENVPYGSYFVKEVEAPEGYVLNETPEKVTITEQGDTAKVTVKDEKQKGKITVVKTSSTTGSPLSGVLFGVYQDGKAVLNDKGEALEDKTDENGKVVFSGLLAGKTYTIKEKAAIDGYTTKWQSDNGVVDLSKGTDVELPLKQDAEVTLSLNNIPYKGTIKVKKSGEDGAPLSGTTFGLFDKNNPETSIETALTNDAGVVTFEDVPYGTYTVKETKAKEGYVLIGTSYDVAIAADGTTYWVPGEGKSILNEKIKGNIEFTKVDEAGNPLSGVTFTLYQGIPASGAALTSVTTKADGKVLFKNVEYGNYTIKETTPEGYMPIPDLTATIKENGKTVNLGTRGRIVNHRIKGNIEFTKVDEAGNTLSGVTFTLYQGTPASGAALTSVTTKADGKVLFENVEYGSYTIKETTPEGYVQVLDLTATIKENGKTVNLGKVVNNRIKGNIQFTKVDADGYSRDPQKIIPIPGVVFSLYQAKLQDGKYVKDGNGVATAASDAGGVVEFKNVLYGHYVMEEQTPGEGYNGSRQLLHVQITENGKTVIPTEDGYFTNKVITGTVKLKKTDENGAALAGAKFTLSNDKRSYTATSDSDGKVVFTDVLYGTYTLTEESAPTMYDRWEGSKEVKVETQDQIVDKGTVTNTLIRGSIEVSKTSAFDNTPLENASFTLYRSMDDEGKPADPVQKDGKPYTVTTDQDGKAVFQNLPYGTYYVQESEAPEGYLLNDEVKTVQILETKAESYKVTFVDEKIRGSVEITKLDADDNAKLSGAKFKLFEVSVKDGKEVLGNVFKEGESGFEAVTGDDGIAVIENIPYGSYFVKEVEAPKGYVLNEKPFKIVIKEEGDTGKLSVSNAKQKESLKIPTTSSDEKAVVHKAAATSDSSDPELSLMALLTSAAMLGVLLRRKKRISKKKMD